MNIFYNFFQHILYFFIILYKAAVFFLCFIPIVKIGFTFGKNFPL